MNAVSVSKLTKEYKKFKIDNVSFELPSGCIMGLVGENGAGKSTLIKMICGVVLKTSGEINLLGESDVDKFYTVREDVGVVPDEIAFPKTFKVKNVDKMMSYAYKNWDRKVFDNYVERFGVPKNVQFQDYSFGEKKKLGIAVALSHNPKLLILDEATSGLDPVVRGELLDVLYDFTRDEEHSVLFSSHIVSDLEKLCDYIAVMHKGKLIMCEEKDVLLDTYCMLNGSEKDFDELPESAVIGKRESPYGVQIIAVRKAVPEFYEVENVTIEDLFTYMVKGGIQ